MKKIRREELKITHKVMEQNISTWRIKLSFAVIYQEVHCRKSLKRSTMGNTINGLWKFPVRGELLKVKRWKRKKKCHENDIGSPHFKNDVAETELIKKEQLELALLSFWFVAPRRVQKSKQDAKLKGNCHCNILRAYLLSKAILTHFLPSHPTLEVKYSLPISQSTCWGPL